MRNWYKFFNFILFVLRIELKLSIACGQVYAERTISRVGLIVWIFFFFFDNIFYVLNSWFGDRLKARWNFLLELCYGLLLSCERYIQPVFSVGDLQLSKTEFTIIFATSEYVDFSHFGDRRNKAIKEKICLACKTWNAVCDTWSTITERDFRFGTVSCPQLIFIRYCNIQPHLKPIFKRTDSVKVWRCGAITRAKSLECHKKMNNWLRGESTTSGINNYFIGR